MACDYLIQLFTANPSGRIAPTGCGISPDKRIASPNVTQKVYRGPYIFIKQNGQVNTYDAHPEYEYQQRSRGQNEKGAEYLSPEHPAGVSGPPDRTADDHINRLPLNREGGNAQHPAPMVVSAGD
jgi:hypothetical protein